MTGHQKGWLAVLALWAGLLLGGWMVTSSLKAVAAGTDWNTLLRSMPEGYRQEGRALGRPDAPVQMVLYGDFQCGHCERLHREVEPELVWRYVATGKLRLEVVPVAGLGPESALAAEAALCAAQQGRFWEYRDALYTAWRQAGKTAYSPEGLVTVAQQTGLKVEPFIAALANRTEAAEVEKDMRRAVADGVTAVPFALVGDRKIDGAKPFAAYEQPIQEVLSR